MAEVALLSGSTPWGFAVEQTSAERWPNVDRQSLLDAQDPWKCSADLLPWLAHNRGVRLWYDDWPDFRKRQVIDQWPSISRLIGTIKAIRMCLALVDARLVKYELPPQRPYLGVSLTGERRQKWLAHLPQLRLYEYRSRYTPPAYARFVGRNFVLKAGGAIPSPDPAAAYYGVRAFLWKDGVETALKVAELTRTSTTRFSDKLVRLQKPARTLTGAFRTGGRVGYLRPTGDAAAQFYTVNLTQSAASTKADITIREYELGFDAVDTRYEEVAESYAPPAYARFVGRSTPGGTRPRRMICSPDPAYLHLYQRIYYYDEAAVKYALRPSGTFVAGRARLGMKPFTGHLYVDIRERSVPGRFRTNGPLGRVATYRHTRLKRAVDAVKIAQGGTDAMVIHTKIFSPITLGDKPPLDGTYRLGQMIRRF